MTQIKGAVNFPISSDSTTWIFDDRKVAADDLERGVFDGTRPVNFDDNKEWNCAILEGQTNPPAPDSEIKYKKRPVLDETLVINMTPFFKNTEPMEDTSTIKLSNRDYSTNVSTDLLLYLFFQFSSNGKRLCSDNAVDSFIYIPEEGYSHQSKYVTHIEVI